MLTKEFISKYLWVICVSSMLIGSLVVSFNLVDFIYLLIFLSGIILVESTSEKVLEDEID